ncbi:rCG63391 [Rattus norvegicus]|uniref:RCG63391 n=1 Tax=Rattus norvegicus TaxID=10116 RepID=A6JEY5_RAT|nr:rCG63391 [Rattus norvegicus]
MSGVLLAYTQKYALSWVSSPTPPDLSCILPSLAPPYLNVLSAVISSLPKPSPSLFPPSYFMTISFLLFLNIGIYGCKFSF